MAAPHRGPARSGLTSSTTWWRGMRLANVAMTGQTASAMPRLGRDSSPRNSAELSARCRSRGPVPGEPLSVFSQRFDGCGKSRGKRAYATVGSDLDIVFGRCRDGRQECAISGIASDRTPENKQRTAERHDFWAVVATFVMALRLPLPQVPTDWKLPFSSWSRID